MKIFGLKLVPVLVAAVAAYAIGFLIYGALFSSQWMEWNGYTKEELAPFGWKMALGWIMPLSLSIGLGMMINKSNISTLKGGAQKGLKIGVFLVLACQMYTFAYSPHPIEAFLLDAVHILLISTVAGAILGAMKVGDNA